MKTRHFHYSNCHPLKKIYAGMLGHCKSAYAEEINFLGGGNVGSFFRDKGN